MYRIRENSNSREKGPYRGCYLHRYEPWGNVRGGALRGHMNNYQLFKTIISCVWFNCKFITNFPQWMLIRK